jgi:hypothetical protein
MEVGAPMFVESSFHIVWDNQKNMFYSKNAEPIHLEFQEQYHVPSISFTKAVLPHFWSDESSKFYEMHIFADYRYVHMRPRGQAIIAAMVMKTKTFENILEETPQPFELPKNLQFIPEPYYKCLDEQAIFQVNFNDKFKLGFDDGTYPLPFAYGQERIYGASITMPHTFYLTFLKSCENVGIAQISLEDCKPGYNFTIQEVNCLWKPRSSQSFVFSMDFEHNQSNQQDQTHFSCIYITS